MESPQDFTSEGKNIFFGRIWSDLVGIGRNRSECMEGAGAVRGTQVIGALIFLP